MKTIAMVLCATLFLAARGLAADVSGTWTGTLTFEVGNGESESAFVTFRQEGDKVTGSAGPNQQQLFPLTGAVKDDRLSFEVKRAGDRSIRFELQITGDQMSGRGQLVRDGQSAGTAVLTLKRETR